MVIEGAGPRALDQSVTNRRDVIGVSVDGYAQGDFP